MLERTKLTLGIDPMAQALDALLHDREFPVRNEELYAALKIEAGSPGGAADKLIAAAMRARGYEKTYCTYDAEGNRGQAWRRVEQ